MTWYISSAVAANCGKYAPLSWSWYMTLVPALAAGCAPENNNGCMRKCVRTVLA